MKSSFPNLNELRRQFPQTVENLALLPNREAWLERVWEIEQRWNNFRENPDKTEEVVFYNSAPKDLEIEAEFEIIYAGGFRQRKSRRRRRARTTGKS